MGSTLSGAPPAHLLLGAIAPVPGARLERVVVGRVDGAIEVWDLARRARVTSLRAHGNAVSDLAVSADGALVASAAYDGVLRVQRLAGGEVALDLGERGDRARRVAFRPGAPRTLLVGTARGPLLTLEVRP